MTIILRILAAGLLALSALCHAETPDNPVFSFQWQAFPYEQTPYDYSGKRLSEYWFQLNRATDYPFPDAGYLSSVLAKNAELKLATPEFESIEQLAEKLQQAWREFYKGNFQLAATQGYALGPIGHGVAFYAQATYGLRLENDKDRRHALWEDIIARHEKTAEQTRHDIMARYFAFYAMARLSEEISSPTVLSRGYMDTMTSELNAMAEAEPYNVFVLAAKGSMDAGIVRKMGHFMGRMAYGADDQVVENYYNAALAQNRLIANVHLEAAQSLLYIYKQKALDRALEQMRIAAGITPISAMEALDSFHAKKLLKELEDIQLNNGIGLRDYIKRGTESGKNYYL
ncbi:MAG: hypothetical protein LRY66_13050 [Saccharospirillaceae bacterium]|nr:hypothetical protein [Saccharospirillaceae bacterium]MCD8532239.1 hypothetical protein [Saccharospirillaceae bacterium]